MTRNNATASLLLPIVAAAAIGAAPPDRTITGFEPLKTTAASPELCTGDLMWCIGTQGRRAPIVFERNGRQVARWAPGAADADAGVELSALPALLRLHDDSVLVALRARTPMMYSGGGGEITALRLLRIKAGETPRMVLSVPWKTDLMIRACFSDRDARRRAGACHDQYELEGGLTVTPPVGTAPPTLRYASAARYSPRGISRGVDSLTRPPLKKADLVWTDDPACTYSRTLRFDPASGTYRPDVPLPACDQYTK
jgi:hypothetical protein